MKEQQVSWASAMALVGVSLPKPVVSNTPEALIDFAEKHFSMPAGFFSKKASRSPQNVAIRNMVRYYLDRQYTISHGQIAHLTCLQDRSTVNHSLKKHSEWIGIDKKYTREYEAFSKEAMRLGYHMRDV